MYFEAHLDLFTITKLVQEATPVRLHFGKADGNQRWIELATPTCVTLVEGKGVLIETAARVHYAWGGLEPEIDIRRIVLMLSPVVVQGEEGLELQFHLDIEDADLVNVPGLIDAGIVGIVNAAITPENTKMTWAFEQTLRASIPLSSRFEPLVGFALQATGGSATVDADHVRLRIAVTSAFSRAVDTAVDEAASSLDALAQPDAGAKESSPPTVATGVIAGDDDADHEEAPSKQP